MSKLVPLCLAAVAAISACSDDKSDANMMGGGGTTGSAGAGAGGKATDLAPPPAGMGVQIKMLSEVAPGIETERCKFVQIPAEGYAVTRQEIKFTKGSHHILVYTTPYKEIPTKDHFGEAVDTSDVFECGKQGPTGHWDIDGIAGGSQSADGPPVIGGLPADVAVKFPGGSILLLNAHYLNASDKPIMTDVRINLFTMPADQVKQEAGFLFFYNTFIRVSAKSTGEARAVCPILSDISLLNAQNHMHKRGVGYLANLIDDKGAVIEELSQGTEWADVRLKELSPPKLLKAGQAIDYRCKYDNKEDRVVTQGRSTADEMCLFGGLYYPRNRRLELCSLNENYSGAYLSAQWIGNGDKTGPETVGCLTAAKPMAMDKGDSFYGCVVNSCPKISRQMSNAARCLATRGLGMCTADCAMGAAQCQMCVGVTCTPLLMELGAAKCE